MAIDLPGTGEVVEIVDTRFGLMAVGIDDAGTTLWTSSNGITWDQATASDGHLAGAEVNALVETELVGATVTVVVENGQMARLWEWVPPAG
ncbi:MAG: hypothetical protein ACXW15_00565 [Acidimicrobiia bacterium]